MELHPELWQCYFDDFLLYKLRLGGLRRGSVSQHILSAYFGQLHEQEPMARAVSLHCYVRAYHMHPNLANMVSLLRSLNQTQQVRVSISV